MSLNIYRSLDEVPADLRVVRANDSYFNAFTWLQDCSFVRDVLKGVDKATYKSEDFFIGRTEGFGALNRQNLSTGTKTILNIHSHPECCFDVIECGDNALNFLPEITNGNIVWKQPFTVYTGDGKCDILYRGIHFSNFYDFLVAVEKEDDISEDLL